jgi:hypothetical protein
VQASSTNGFRRLVHAIGFMQQISPVEDQSSRAISHVNVELVSEASETECVSMIMG